MARKSAEPQNTEPEDGSGEISEGQEGPGPVGKSDAVKRALAAGYEGPQEGTAWIRDQFGVEVSPGYFSAVKATEKKKGWTKKGKPGRKPKGSGQAGGGGGKSPDDGEGDLIDTLEALKPLIANHGAEKVKRLVDLLG